MDAGVDWWLWRLALCSDLPSHLRDPWAPTHTFIRAIEAHAVIDLLEAHRVKAEADAERDAQLRAALGRR